MKLTQRESIVEHAGDIDEAYDFSIDTEQMNKMFHTYISGIYADKISSFVREIATNGFDAHVEAGNTTDPVEVNFDEESREIAFRDYGIGLSKDRVKNIFVKMGASTKNKTDNFVGGYGIGAKSPLAYTDSMWVTTWHNGTQYNYLVHTNDGKPKMELLDQSVSDKRSGTEVKLLVKPTDIPEIKNAIITQLSYLKNIVYKGTFRRNDIKILEGNTFLMLNDVSRNHVNLNKLHICLGGIYYPLPERAKIPEAMVSIPAALKFEVGELMPTVNRENIEQTDENLEIINKRLLEFQQELIDRYKAMPKRVAHNTYQFLKMQEEDVNIPLPDGWGDIRVKRFTSDYDRHIEFKTGIHPSRVEIGSRWYTTKLNYGHITSIIEKLHPINDNHPFDVVRYLYTDLPSNTKVYYTEKPAINGHKNKYLTETLNCDHVIIKLNKVDYDEILKNFNIKVSNDHVEKWLDQIVDEFRAIVKSKGTCLDTVDVPKGYFNKKKVKVDKANKLTLHVLRYGAPTTQEVDKWKKSWKDAKCSHVIAVPYGLENVPISKQVMGIFKHIKIYKVSKSHWDNAIKIGMIPMDEWLKSDHYCKLLYRANTICYIKQSMTRHSHQIKDKHLRVYLDDPKFFTMFNATNKTWHELKKIYDSRKSHFYFRYSEDKYVLPWAKKAVQKLIEFYTQLNSDVLKTSYISSLSNDELRVLTNLHKVRLDDPKYYLKPINQNTDEQDHSS